MESLDLSLVESVLNSKSACHDGAADSRYLFFDTETTGLPFNYDAPSYDLKNWPRLVQLSWILTDSEFDIVSRQDYIVYPESFSIPSAASCLHRVTNAMAKIEGVKVKYVINNFMSDFQKATCLVGHNVSFDKKIVGAEMIRLGLQDIMDKKDFIDTMVSSTEFCKIPSKGGYKWPKLQELYKALFGCEYSDAHDSMSDVKATLECFKELTNRGIIRVPSGNICKTSAGIDSERDFKGFHHDDLTIDDFAF